MHVSRFWEVREALEKSAYLRNLPRCIDLEERLRSEAIVTACDIIEFSFTELMRLLSPLIGRDVPDVSEAERIQSALHCWSIVDQFYALRKLSKTISAKFGLTILDEFYPSVSKMRNAMDHLNNNLGNVGRKKGPNHPLHGAILFACGLNKAGNPEYITFGLGSLHHDSNVSPVIDVYSPILVHGVSNITFAAFGAELNLSKLTSTLREAVTRFDKETEMSALEKIREFARVNNVDADALINDRISGTMKIRMKFEFSANPTNV